MEILIFWIQINRFNVFAHTDGSVASTYIHDCIFNCIFNTGDTFTNCTCKVHSLFHDLFQLCEH